MVEKEVLELFDNNFSGCVFFKFEEEFNQFNFFLVGILMLDDSDFGRSYFELIINHNLIIAGFN
jgi:hypothetical protein